MECDWLLKMTTGYQEFTINEPFLSSHPMLMANDKNALTDNADTTFPANPLTGMTCHRTDEKKIYRYDGTKWVMVINLNDLPITHSEGEKIRTAINKSRPNNYGSQRDRDSAKPTYGLT